jgi:uncharacterized protein DUF4386
MSSARRSGRIIGLLLLAHLATGLIVPYVMLQQLLPLPDGFLASAAAVSLQVRLSVMTLLVGAAVTICIAVAGWPTFRMRSYSLGVWLVALGAVNLSLQVGENAQWLSLMSLSEAFVKAGPGELARFQSLAIVVRSALRWAHYSHLLVVVAWMFVLFVALYRGALVPRFLAAFGMVGAVGQVAAITMPVLMGYRVPFPTLFGMPLGVFYLAMAVWLLVKGFPERRN